jgi:hypothetical protein
MSDVSVSLGVTGKSEVIGSLKQVGVEASRLSKIGASIGSLLAPVASIATVAAGFAGIKESLDLGGQLTDLANKTGIGTGALYELSLAGRGAGLSIDDIASSVNKLQKGLGKAESDSVLRSLGLDPKSLASASPEVAFQKIGQAIAALQNPTAQVQASMALFGKSGASMLQLFNDPSFKNGIGSSQAAEILAKNAAIFDRLGDSIDLIRPRITEFFSGFTSENAANLERMATAIDRLDLSQAGVNAGTVVATLTEAVAQGQFGEVLSLSMTVAAEKFINNMVGGALAMGRALYETIELIFRPETWKAFGNTLMSLVNSFNATLMQGIGMILTELGKAPVIGQYFTGAAASVQGLGMSYSETAAKQGSSAADLSSFLFDDIVKKVKSSFDFGQLIDTSGTEAQLQTLTDSIYSGLQSANEEARAKADSQKKTGAYNASDIGMAGKQSIVADSLAKVGGGGFAVGPGSNPILEENKRQTAYLSELVIQGRQNRMASSAGAASFDGLTA